MTGTRPEPFDKRDRAAQPFSSQAGVGGSRTIEAVQMQEAKYFLAAIIESCQESVVTVDFDGIITTWNHGAEQLYGYRADEVIGHPITVLTLPEDLQQVLANIESVKHSETVKVFDTVRHQKDGEEIHLEILLSPVKNAEGKVIGVSTFARDITERIRVQEALRVSEERHRLIIEGAKDYAVVTTDLEGVIESWSPGAEAVFGWTALEAVGQLAAMTFVPEDRAADQPAVELGLARREGRAPDVRWHLRKDRSRVFIDGSTWPLKDGRGRLRGYLKVGQDVTERMQLEEALREADRRKDEFLAMLGHELRNPLAAIQHGIEVAASPKASESVRGKMLQLVAQQVKHMKRLVDDVLDVARITQGKLGLLKQSVTLQQVLDQAVGMSQVLISQKGCELHVRVPEQPIPLRADAVRLSQVFSNLLANAAKYGGGSCRIELSAELEGATAVVRVRDYGIGIAPDLLPHVFDLFMQASHTSDRSDGGLGMGLSVVQRLVELHGGSAEAHSEGLGKGSEFVVRLPLTEERG